MSPRPVSCDRGFLRSDKPVGTAQVKLEKLETQSEIREIVEVRACLLDGGWQTVLERA